MISGLNHITFATRDLERSFRFYQEVLGFTPLMRHAKGAYFLAGDLWFCLDLDPATRASALPEYTHVAFSVEAADFEVMSQKIKAAGATVWKENKSEGDSLYFLDPDGHKLEIHTGDWQSRMKSLREKPWNESVQIFETPKSPDSVLFRQAKPEEHVFLSGLAMRSKSYWPYPPDYLEKCIPVLKVTESDIRQWPVQVAETENEVIGFFALKPVDGENWIDHLWIDPRFIGTGLGKRLFTLAVEKAKELGWRKFAIAADPYAEPFYLKMGAKKIGSIQSRIKTDLFLPHLEMSF